MTQPSQPVEPAPLQPAAPKQSALSGCLSLIVLGGIALWFWDTQHAATVQQQQFAAEGAVLAARARRHGPLAGVAVWATRAAGLQICARETLTNCTVDLGNPPGVGGTVRWTIPALAPAANCDTQTDEAFTACSSDGSSPVGDDAAREVFARCSTPRGVLWRGVLAPVLDPRDPQQAPGGFRMECDQGTKSGSFGR